MTNRSRHPRRPATWMRCVAGLVFVLLVMDSLDERDVTDLVANALVGVLVLTAAIAPRSLYDERRNDWLRTHRVIRAGLTALLCVAMAFLLLSALEVI